MDTVHWFFGWVAETPFHAIVNSLLLIVHIANVNNIGAQLYKMERR